MSVKWFKNLHIFYFEEAITLTAEELQQQFATMTFRPCGAHDWFSQGWIAPIAETADVLAHSSNNCIFFMLCKQEKLLPAKTIRDAIANKVNKIELDQSRRVGKREKNDLKEQVVHDLLPRAFTQNTETAAYLDLTHQWLMIDTPSRKKAEEFVSFLRTCVDTLPVVPLMTPQPPVESMTMWLKNRRPPKPFTFGEDCKLIAGEGESVTCKQLDLLSTEVQEHLRAGKLVQQLALQWNDRVAFVLDDKLTIRRIKLLDIIQEQYEHLADAHSHFAMMTLELAKLLQELLEVLSKKA